MRSTLLAGFFAIALSSAAAAQAPTTTVPVPPPAAPATELTAPPMTCPTIAAPAVIDPSYKKFTVEVHGVRNAAMHRPVRLQMRGVDGLDRSAPNVKQIKKCDDGSVAIDFAPKEVTGDIVKLDVHAPGNFTALDVMFCTGGKCSVGTVKAGDEAVTLKGVNHRIVRQ